MKKYIITRLGLEFPEKNGNGKHLENQKDYVLETIMEMLDFTYHSILNQTAKDIVWVFFTGSRFNDVHRDIIEDVVNIPVVFTKEVNFGVTRKLWDQESIVLRLDADDFMHPELIEKVESNLMEKYNGNNIVICNPTKGYKLFPDMTLTEFDAPHIALGQGVLSNCGANPMHNHTQLVQRISETFPGRDVVVNNLETDERLYLYRRHKKAHSFIFDANYKEKEKLSKEKTEKILAEFNATSTPFYMKNNEKNNS